MARSLTSCGQRVDWFRGFSGLRGFLRRQRVQTPYISHHFPKKVTPARVYTLLRNHVNHGNHVRDGKNTGCWKRQRLNKPRKPLKPRKRPPWPSRAVRPHQQAGGRVLNKRNLAPCASSAKTLLRVCVSAADAADAAHFAVNRHTRARIRAVIGKMRRIRRIRRKVSQPAHWRS